MTTSIRGSLAATALCAALAACGGNSTQPTPLPASVQIASAARVETGAQANFATDIANTEGLTFRWDFGDGTSASGPSASHAYATSGSYRVTLAVSNSAEDLRSSTTSVQVGAYANVAGLSCSKADAGGWCWQHAIVTGHQINDVFFLDATHAWAVGDGLTILKSADGGTSWTPAAVDPGTASASLQSVRFYDARHGLVLTDQGWALQTSDGGATWTTNSLNGNVYASSFVAYDANRIVLQSQYSGTTVASVDGGNTWTTVAASGAVQATATDCWGVYSSSLQRAPGCGTSATNALVLAYDPASNSYQSLMAAAFASPTQAMALGYSYAYDTYTTTAQVWTSADAGASWTSFVPAGLPYSYYYYGLSLHLDDALHGELYTANGLTVYATQDGGHDWTTVTSSAAIPQAYSAYTATGFVGAALWQSSGTHLAISTDHGQTWHDAHLSDEDTAQTVQNTPVSLTQYTDADNYVVAASHRFYVTHDGGQTFKRILGPDSRDAGAAYAAGAFLDAKHGSFVTSRGAVLATADGGQTWTRTDYPALYNQPVAMHFNAANDGWLILGGTLAHTTDGKSWATPLADAAMTNLLGMSWFDAAHAWVWSNGTLYATADGGTTWTTLTLPAGVQVASALATGAQAGVLATTYGDYRLTADGGATWTTVAAIGGTGTLVRGGDGQTIWSLGGTASRSRDGGRTWQLSGPSNYTATSLSFADASHGWMVSSAGVVQRTDDGGDTWSTQSLGADLWLQAVVATDASTAWIMTRDGQVLATATAGN